MNVGDQDEHEESFAEITDGELYDAFERYDEDYQRWEDDFEENETGNGLRNGKTGFLWSLERCESYAFLSEHDEEPDTTDPYLSHKLHIPYNRTLRPRYFASAGKDVEYGPNSLPRRPRSPIRKILPGKFDLKSAYEEWSRERRIMENRQCLRESKERVSLSLRRLPVDQTDRCAVISSVVLQAVCEEVTLTLMDTKIDTDIHTFVNIAVIWALSELELFTHDTLIEHFTLPKDFEAPDRKSTFQTQLQFVARTFFFFFLKGCIDSRVVSDRINDTD
ncbi:uncharacterized protein LOC143342777 [Colletes latitarsis]|uniref:uncharacterized protein LOC143342777 n=1 Tax=Colletes latitarsis TaxID=2605962 RepID=UPI004036070A